MMRLTVHIENAPFEKRERKNLGTINNPIYKPKKSECIMNTLTVRDLNTMDEVNKELAYIKDNYKIAKWKSGMKMGEEMIYIANQ